MSGRSWFRLTVGAARARWYEQPCYVSRSCLLTCPEDHVPAGTNRTWWKVRGRRRPGEGLGRDGGLSESARLRENPAPPYFPSVKESDRGVYTCTRQYRFRDRLYNATFTLQLDVRPNGRPAASPAPAFSGSNVPQVRLGYLSYR